MDYIKQIELITNSIKHAFLEKKDAEVFVGMKNIDNHYYLTISDNGIGFPKNINFKNTKSLGMQVVASLTEQLEGSIELLDGNGTAFEISV